MKADSNYETLNKENIVDDGKFLFYKRNVHKKYSTL
jgi:hypothetical protein